MPRHAGGSVVKHSSQTSWHHGYLSLGTNSGAKTFIKMNIDKQIFFKPTFLHKNFEREKIT